MSIGSLFLLGLLFFIGMILGQMLWYGIYATKLANQANWGSFGLNYLDGINRLFCHYYHRLRYKQSIPLPPKGAAVVIANHLSLLDPLLLVAAGRRPMRFLVQRQNYERFGLRWLFRATGAIPVDKAGMTPEVTLQQALKALQDGEVIALFPQGKVTLPADFPQALQEDFLWLSQKTGAPIYPVYIAGIKGTGNKLRSLLRRSHAKLTTFPGLECRADSSPQSCLSALQALFEGNAG